MAGLSGIEAFAAPAQPREQKTVAPVEHGAAVTHRDVRAEPRVDPAGVTDRNRALEDKRERDPRRDKRREEPEEEAAEGKPGQHLDITV